VIEGRGEKERERELLLSDLHALSLSPLVLRQRKEGPDG